MKDYHEVAENVFRRRDKFEEKKAARRLLLKKITASLPVFAITIAFLFTAGTCYVFAVGLGIVEDTLGICDYFFDMPITQKQQDAIKDAAVLLGETVTSDGFSVTAQSAFCDRTNAFVLLNIVAPENIDLYQSGVHFNIEDERAILKGDNPRRWTGSFDGGWSQYPLADQDGAKNTMKLLFRYHTNIASGGTFSFADGYDRYLILEGLDAHKPDFPYTEYQISDGTWNFRIRFDDSFSKDERELLDSPITLKCRSTLGVQQTATVHSIVVRGLSISLRYTYAVGAVQEPSDFGLTIKVVLTDGTVIDVDSKSGSKLDNGEFMSTYLAETPILVEDIDYIQIGETIIPLLEE